MEEEEKLEKNQRSEEQEQEAMSIDNLKQFVELNLGKWNGTFYVSRKNSTLSSIVLFFKF